MRPPMPHHLSALLLATLGAWACNDTVKLQSISAAPEDSGEPVEAVDDTDPPDDTDTDPPDDTGGDTGEEEEEEPPPPPPPPELVRFVALGDGGEGNDDQYAVAAAMKAVCDAKDDELGDGCSFALYMGDNFYDDGVDGVDDDQFQDKFELPYADIDFPFMVVLGNHDYGVTSLEPWKVSAQVEYTDHSTKWTMPDRYYEFIEEHVQFLGLDTNAIMVEAILGESGQDTWLDDAIAFETSVQWRIAYGHHPYLSNGEHGNAGNFEGTSWLPIVNGDSIKDFVEDHMCGQIDVYLCGHDHNRQWIGNTCGTEFIVAGAAAKTTDFAHRDGNSVLFEDDTAEGFLWVEIRDNVLTGEFYDKDGTLQFTHTLTK